MIISTTNNQLLKKSIRFFLSTASVLSMTLSPLAEGAQAEKQAQIKLTQSVQTYLTDAGFTQKRLTFKQYFENTKHLYPNYVYDSVEKYFMQTPDKLMPEVKYSESKNSLGESIPVLTVVDGKEQFTLQILGEKDKFLKLGSTYLSETDLLRITPAVDRLSASDIKVRDQFAKAIKLSPEVQKGPSQFLEFIKQRDAELKAQARAQVEKSKEFEGYPKVTAKVWNKMTAEQKALYIIHMRQLWRAAREVNDLGQRSPSSVNPSREKNKESKPKNTSGLNYLRLLFGDEAFAEEKGFKLENGRTVRLTPAEEQERARAKTRSVGNKSVQSLTPVNPSVQSEPIIYRNTDNPATKAENKPVGDVGKIQVVKPEPTYNGPSLALKSSARSVKSTNTERSGFACVITGFSAKYSSNGICDYNTAKISSEGKSDKFKKFVEQINKDQSLCKKDNKYACNRLIFSGASATEPHCVTSDAIQTATVSNGACDAKSSLGDNKGFDLLKDKTKTGAERYAKENIKSEDELKAHYREQQLKEGSTIVPNFLKGLGYFLNGSFSDSDLAELVEIQSLVNDEITAAKKKCEKASDVDIKHEKNFHPACDHLHERFLFIGDYLAKNPGCKDGGQFDHNTFKCKCEAKGANISERTVNPGESCSAAPVLAENGCTKPNPLAEAVCTGPAEPPATAPVVEQVDCNTYAPGSTTVSKSENGKTETNCVCKNGELPKEKKSKKKNDTSLGAKFGLNKDEKSETTTRKCDDDFNWAPVAIFGALAIGVGVFAFTRGGKKKPVNPPICPASLCPNGKPRNPANCGCDIVPPITCPAPKQNINGVCRCAIDSTHCTPPLLSYNDATCQCTYNPQPPKTKVCPDGRRIPINETCPVPPPPPPETEGGSGEPGGGSGGVPDPATGNTGR